LQELDESGMQELKENLLYVCVEAASI